MDDEIQPAVTRRRKRRRLAVQIFMPRHFTPRSKQRFVRARTRALLEHIGPEASVSQQILVSRAIRCEWDLLRLDSRFDRDGELSEHASRVRAALENRLRLDLTALGLKAAPLSPDAAMRAILRRSRRRKAAP